ncbi:hypothetical protein ACS0TY_023865 [Phlomoides rotata]
MTASSNSVTNETLKRKSNDIGWEYAVLSDPLNLDRVKCILCEKQITGGIYRVKQHIAGVRGMFLHAPKAAKMINLSAEKH